MATNFLKFGRFVIASFTVLSYLYLNVAVAVMKLNVTFLNLISLSSQVALSHLI